MKARDSNRVDAVGLLAGSEANSSISSSSYSSIRPEDDENGRFPGLASDPADGNRKRGEADEERGESVDSSFAGTRQPSKMPHNILTSAISRSLGGERKGSDARASRYVEVRDGDNDDVDVEALRIAGEASKVQLDSEIKDETIRGSYFGDVSGREGFSSHHHLRSFPMEHGSNLALGTYDEDGLDVTSASYMPDDTFDYISSGMRGYRGGSAREMMPTSSETLATMPALVQQQSNKASWLSCYINITNTIVGSGMLGLPYAFAHTGWALGLLMLSAAALLSTVGLRLLALAAAHAPRPASFHGAASAALPPLAASLIDVAVAIKCFGVATSYLIIVSDMMPDVMIHAGAPAFLAKPVVWVTLAMAIVSPLSIPRSLDALRHTSGAALVFVIMCVALIVTYSTGSIDPCATSTKDDSTEGLTVLEDACEGPVHAFYPRGEGRGLLGVVRVLPIFVFSFTCHQNAFTVVNELRDPTLARVNSVFRYAVASAFVVYLVVALCGYSTFGDLVESDILRNYPRNVYTTGCRLLIALLVLSSYPLQCHPARRSILNLVAAMIDGQQIDLCRRSPRGRNGESNSSPFALLDNHSPTSDGTYVITTTTSRSSAALAEGAAFPDDGAMNSPAIASMLTLNGPDAETLQSRYNKTTFFFLLLSYLCAIAVSDISFVLAVVGATGSTLVCYILPGGIYMAIYHRMKGWNTAAYLWALLGIDKDRNGDGGAGVDSTTNSGIQLVVTSPNLSDQRTAWRNRAANDTEELEYVHNLTDAVSLDGVVGRSGSYHDAHSSNSSNTSNSSRRMSSSSRSSNSGIISRGEGGTSTSTTGTVTTNTTTTTFTVSWDYVASVGLTALGFVVMPVCLAAIAMNN